MKFHVFSLLLIFGVFQVGDSHAKDESSMALEGRCLQRMYGPSSKKLTSALYYLRHSPEAEVIAQGFLDVPQHFIAKFDRDRVVLKSGLVLMRRSPELSPASGLLYLTLPTGVKMTARLETNELRRWVGREYIYDLNYNPDQDVIFDPGVRDRFLVPADLGEEFFEARAKKQLENSETYRLTDN
ncbi:MAG: hypothetical protein AAF202_14070, partial [Pseudomonadota bacterium]